VLNIGKAKAIMATSAMVDVVIGSSAVSDVCSRSILLVT
jgi:hypothetical protein